jgi:hypothetical protein
MADTYQAGPNGVGNQQPENTEWMYGDAGYSLNTALGTMSAAVGSYTGSLTAGSEEIVNAVVAKITNQANAGAAAATTGGAAGGTTGTAGTTAGTATTGTTGTAGTSNMQDQAGITKK